MSSSISNIQYNESEAAINEIQTYYSRVLDASALNVSDRIGANVGYFNNSGKVFADPTRVGKTVVFVTRPNLNLRSLYNIRNSKIFSYFVSSKLGVSLMRMLMYGPTAGYMVYGKYPSSISRLDTCGQKIPIIGSTTDSMVGGMIINDASQSLPILRSNFIPLLTNTCIETSNAKDIILETNETDGNFNGDKLTYASGIDETMSVGEITLTFEDLYNSPVMNLFYIWIMYMHYVGKGLCDPEWAYIVNRIIDYTSGIYVFMLGSDHQTILRWTRYTGSFPRTIPFGNILHSREINQQSLSNISVPFAYNFASPMDPTVLSEFNMISGASLFDRFCRLGKGNYANALYGHTCSMNDAMYILKDAQPVYNSSNPLMSDLPMKALEQILNTKQLPKSTNFEGTGFQDDSVRMLSLMNRERGNIVNNWYGVPYIVDGNKLMWL